MNKSRHLIPSVEVEIAQSMAVKAALSMSFHNMDVANGEIHEDTQRCESHCFEQQRQKDILLEGEICQRFMELWHAKRELLIYRAFVTRFPNCALWYDQISGSIPPETQIEIVTSERFDCGSDSSSILSETEIEILTSEMFDSCSDTCSIPPETEIEIVTSEMYDSGSDTCSIPPEAEIEIVTSEMFDSGSDTSSISPETEIEIVTSEVLDSGSDTSNEEHLFAEFDNKELICCSNNDKDHLYSNANSKEHLHNYARSAEHLYCDANSKEHVHNYARSAEHFYCDASSKEPRGSNWEERVFSQASNEGYTLSQIDNTENLYGESIRKEHIYSGTSNKEHFHSDKNNKEQLQLSDNEKEIMCKGLQIEKLQHENCNSEHRTHSDSDVQGNVHEVTNMGNQVFSDSNECINEDCESKEVCHESSNIIHSKLDQNDSCSIKLPVPGEVTLKHNMILEADVPTGGHFTEARDVPFHAENCSHSGIVIDDVVSSASEASSVADSTIQSVVEEANISHRCTDPGIELAVQLVHDEHGYASWSYTDHSYTDRADLPYSSGHCQDCFAVDGQDAAEEFGHGELMARLQEAHEDLKIQVFLYVREIFSEWVRGNPGEEFDISSLDRYLLAVASPFMQVQFVDEQ